MNYIKKNIFKIVLLASLSLVLIAPMLSLAQNGTNPPSGGNGTNPPPTNVASSGKLENPIGSDTLKGFIKNILEGVLKISIPIIALAIIYCGFLFVSARGRSKEIETAKTSLTYTLIGTAILLGAWAIAQLIYNTVLAL